MAISFPASPTNGQKFTSGTTVYTYSTATGAWDAAKLDTALPFNFFVNPSFQISQQNGNAVLTGSGSYPADNWWFGLGGVVVPSWQRVQVPTGRGSPNRLRCTITTPDASLASGDHLHLMQRVEAARLAPFGWATATKVPMVIRFWIKAPAGTYPVSVRNHLDDYNYMTTFTVSAGQANTETERTFAIPVPPAGTWQGSGVTTWGLQFGIGIAFTAPYVGGTTGWQAASAIYAPAGTTNGIATAGAVYEFSDFGMYLDPLSTGRPPPWEYVSDAQANFDCHRYYQKCMTTLGIGIASTASPQRSTFPCRTVMRGAPATVLVGTLRGWDQATAPNLTAIANNYCNRQVFEFNYTAASAQTAGRGTMVIDASSAIHMAQNARI